MAEDTVVNAIEEQEDYLDQQIDYQDDMAESLNQGYPEKKEQLGLYQLFLKILGMQDSTKVAFAYDKEIGQAQLPVRGYQHMSHLCKKFNYPAVSNYFQKEGEIVLATTMGREGNFPNLFVTQKKFAERSRRGGNNSSTEKKPWSLFGRNKSATPPVK